MTADVEDAVQQGGAPQGGGRVRPDADRRRGAPRRVAVVLLALTLLVLPAVVGALVGALRDEPVRAEALVLASVDPELSSRQDAIFETYAVQVRSRGFIAPTAERVGMSAEKLSESTVVERVGDSDVLRISVSADRAGTAVGAAQELASRFVAALGSEAEATPQESLVQTRLDEVRTQLTMLQAQVAPSPVFPDQPSSAEVQVLVGGITALQQEAATLQERLVDLQLDAAAAADAARVLDPAQVADERALSPAQGAAGGLVVGIVAVAVLLVLLRVRRPTVAAPGARVEDRAGAVGASG